MFFVKIKAALRKIYILLYNFLWLEEQKNQINLQKLKNLPVNNYFVHKIVAFFYYITIICRRIFLYKFKLRSKINV